MHAAKVEFDINNACPSNKPLSWK